MKQLVGLTVALASAVVLASPAWAVNFEVDAAHSNIGFEIKHLMISNVRGSFTDFSGTVKGEGADLTKATAEFVIKAASVNTANQKRDEHLKSPDFLNVEKNPEIKFKSTKVAKAGKDKYKITGDFTMNGVTKSVTFDAQDLGKQKDMMGNLKRGFQASATIARKDFSLTWNKNLDGGGVVLGDNVKINLELEFAEK